MTKLVWIETPSNPLLKIVDIGAVAATAHAAGARVVVDNTFATPALQRPLALGADAVVHSVTKYIGGHSDLIGGAIVTSDEEWIEQLGFLMNAIGAVPGPMDCYLALRGLKTLGDPDAGALLGRPRDRRVPADPPRRTRPCYYPGLADHAGHAIATRQMADFGGMVSFRVGSAAAKALDVVGRTELFFLAESLGGVESLIEVPGPMTHASVAGSPLEVPDDLVRLSVGIEHPDDLIEDSARALEPVAGGSRGEAASDPPSASDNVTAVMPSGPATTSMGRPAPPGQASRTASVARDLDASRSRSPASVVGHHPSGHQVVGHVPGDEERQYGRRTSSSRPAPRHGSRGRRGWCAGPAPPREPESRRRRIESVSATQSRTIGRRRRR